MTPPKRRPAALRVLAVVNLKGGTGKTTCSVHLAHAFAAAGHRPTLVDADPQEQTLRWSELAGERWTIPTLALPVGDLHRRLAGVVHPDRSDVVVIDTPPLRERAGIVASAMRAATDVVVTLSPSMGELERLPAVWRLLEEVEPLMPAPPRIVVLLNRVDARARARREVREVLEGEGRYVLHVEVPRREALAQSFGDPVDARGSWPELVEELDAALPRPRRRAS